MIYLGLVFWSGYSVYVLNNTSIYVENGILENIQVFTITVAGLLLFLPVINQKRTDKLVLLFFAFLCLSFVLREVDVEDLSIPDVLKSVGSGAGRNVILAAGFITIFSFAMFNVTHYKNVVRSFFASQKGAWILMAGILICFGEVFESMKYVPHHVLLEELSELSGYVLILLVAFTYSKKSTERHSREYSESVDPLAYAKNTPLFPTAELGRYTPPNSSPNTPQKADVLK